MLFSVILHRRSTLARGAALLLAASALAGCSSSASRFGGGLDDIFTSSTANQRAIIEEKNQPFPGEQVAAASAVQSSAPASTPVSQSPVQRSALAPVAVAPQTQPARLPEQPRQTAAAPKLDRVTTGATPRPTVRDAVAPTPAAEPAPATAAAANLPEVDSEGWSRAGGTQVTVRDGETVFNLSRRFGVPSSAILRANGLTSANGLAAGSKIVIPTYVYSRAAKVSAPDANPEVADAKSSRGTKFDVDQQKVPVPSKAPENNLAVLPKTPKVKEEQADGQAAPMANTAKGPEISKGTYVVQSGESLSSIARKTGSRSEAIKTANGLTTAHLKIGQKLLIPAAGAVVAAAPAKSRVDPMVTGATGPANKPQVAAYTPPAKPAGREIAAAVEDSDAEAPGATGIGRMRWPARGRVISDYGKGTDGIDIAVPEGTPVKAAENGVVIYAGDGLKEFGNTVLVRHEDGLVTVYGHASELKVARGETVKRGQEIAKSGMSGKTDTPKLHFEVRKDSTPVDPAGFLE